MPQIVDEYYFTLKVTRSENEKVPNNLKSGFCLMQDSEIGKLNNDVIRIDRDKPQSLLDQTSLRRVNLPSTTALDATQ